jgi:hypothetical protein
MTPIFYDFYTGRLFEGFMWGLVFALLGILLIWAAVELANWVFPHNKGGVGRHLDGHGLPKFWRNRHSNG